MTAQPANMRRLRRPVRGAACAARRIRADWQAEVRISNTGHTCTVIDISGGGARISNLPKLRRNANRVWLVVRDGAPIEAEIVWESQAQVGLSFVREQPWVLTLADGRFNPAAWLDATNSNEPTAS